MPETFSERGGYQAPDVEITIREDAPRELRNAILMIAQNLNMPPQYMRHVACSTLLKRPDPSNWSYTNVWNEVNDIIENCPWYKVYDIAEQLYEGFREGAFEDCWAGSEADFSDQLNQFFRENGIGWEIRRGQVMFRGSEVFETTTAEAESILRRSARPRAADEIQEALAAISRRPRPDVTGGVTHAMGALEATARDITGQSNPTFGKLVSTLNLPKPFDTAIEKLWGYSSEYARHIREGRTVNTDEVEFFVSVAAATCTFLTKRNSS